MPLFLELNFNKIELHIELDISNVEFYAYFANQFWRYRVLHITWFC